jgi:hypothetical protein
MNNHFMSRPMATIGSGLFLPIVVPADATACLIGLIQNLNISGFLALALQVANALDLVTPGRKITIAEVLRPLRDRYGRNFIHMLMHSWSPRARTFLHTMLAEYVTPADMLVLEDTFAALDSRGYTIATVAAERNIVEIIQIMQARDIPVGIRNNNPEGLSAVHIAVIREHMGVLEAFGRAGVNMNMPDKNGETPMHWAVNIGDVRRVIMLMQYGAKQSLDRANCWGMSPVKMASAADKGEILNAMGRLWNH